MANTGFTQPDPELDGDRMFSVSDDKRLVLQSLIGDSPLYTWSEKTWRETALVADGIEPDRQIKTEPAATADLSRARRPSSAPAFASPDAVGLSARLAPRDPRAARFTDCG
jgi:hypothetical protein